MRKLNANERSAGFWKHLPSMNLLFAMSFLAVSLQVSAHAASPDFNRDIRPILSGRCFKCHGPDANAREADLRLDRRDNAIDSGAVVAGSPAESILIERITSADPDLRMPPVGDPLSETEIQLLEAWIESGAR